MGKEFGNTEVEKHEFHRHKTSKSINDVDVSKMEVPNRVSFGKKSFKYFIDDKDGRKVRPLCIMLPKMGAWRRDFDKTQYASFLVNDELLEKHDRFWDKVSSNTKSGFDNEPVYNNKY